MRGRGDMNLLETLGIPRAAGVGIVVLGLGLAFAVGLRLVAQRAKASRRTVIDLNGRG